MSMLNAREANIRDSPSIADDVIGNNEAFLLHFLLYFCFPLLASHFSFFLLHEVDLEERGGCKDHCLIMEFVPMLAFSLTSSSRRFSRFDV